MRVQLAGVVVAVVSALLYDVGYVLEKQGLERVPPLRLHPVSLIQTALASRRWLAGFLAMLAALGLQVVALTMAPLSVVQPILAGGLIALAAAGSMFLGERLSRREGLSLALVLVAVTATAISARGDAPLARAVPGERFLLFGIPLAVLGALAGRTGSVRSGSQKSLVAAALGAGLLYGLGAVAEKAVATRLVTHGLIGGAWSALGTGYPWLFVAATLAGMMIFQVGLQLHPASLMASLTNVVSTVCVLTAASVVFSEGIVPSGWSLWARLVGFAAVLGAVGALVSERAQPDEEWPGGDPVPAASAATPAS